jgi:hypothetical protein
MATSAAGLLLTKQRKMRVRLLTWLMTSPSHATHLKEHPSRVSCQTEILLASTPRAAGDFKVTLRAFPRGSETILGHLKLRPWPLVTPGTHSLIMVDYTTSLLL